MVVGIIVHAVDQRFESRHAVVFVIPVQPPLTRGRIVHAGQMDTLAEITGRDRGRGEMVDAVPTTHLVAAVVDAQEDFARRRSGVAVGEDVAQGRWWLRA